MQVIIDNNPVFAKAHERFENFTKDDKLIELYEARRKWEMDRNSAIGYAERKGMEQDKIETAQRMMDDGMSVDIIAKYTELSEEAILKLKKPGK